MPNNSTPPLFIYSGYGPDSRECNNIMGENTNIHFQAGSGTSTVSPINYTKRIHKGQVHYGNEMPVVAADTR